MAAMSVLEDFSHLNVLALSASLFLTYILVAIVHRLYFHPLAEFPGPFWAKLTSVPVWWHSKNQDRHLWLLSLQEQYGQYESPIILPQNEG